MRTCLGSLAQLGMNSKDPGEELEGGQGGRSLQVVSFSNCLKTMQSKVPIHLLATCPVEPLAWHSVGTQGVVAACMNESVSYKGGYWSTAGLRQVVSPVVHLSLPTIFFFFASVFLPELCRCQANISLGLQAEYIALNKLA